MRDNLNKSVMNHGFEIRPEHPCGLCGEITDFGPAMIVPKEDIETHPDFERFRAYRQLERGVGKQGETEVSPWLVIFSILSYPCYRLIEDLQDVPMGADLLISEVQKAVYETILPSAQKEVKKAS